MKEIINNIKKIVYNVEGYLTLPEGELLYNLAKYCQKKGVIVEIGSWKGKSTIWLGKGSKEGKSIEIYAIDPHEGLMKVKEKYQENSTLNEFKKNIRTAKVDDIIIPIIKTSEEAATSFDKPIGLIFIDGLHEYEYSKSDFNLWFPKVIYDGYMAFHDTVKPSMGSKRVVSENVYKSNQFKNVGFVGTITYAQKVEQNTLKDRIRNRYILLLLNLYGITGKLKLPNKIKRGIQKVLKLVQFNKHHCL